MLKLFMFNLFMSIQVILVLYVIYVNGLQKIHGWLRFSPNALNDLSYMPQEIFTQLMAQNQKSGVK